MPEYRVLSGKELISVFSKFGFIISSQRGSHIKLTRIERNAKQTLTVPNHKEIDRGTLKAIIRQASKYIDITELNQYFYK